MDKLPVNDVPPWWYNEESAMRLSPEERLLFWFGVILLIGSTGWLVFGAH